MFPLFFYHNGGDLTESGRITSYCVELCLTGNLKSAVVILNDLLERFKDELCITEHNKTSIDLSLFYKDAAFVYTFSHLNSRAKKYINIAKSLTQNFEFEGNQDYFIQLSSLESEIQVREGNLKKAKASIKRAEKLIKAYGPSVNTPSTLEFLTCSRCWNHLHKGLISLAQRQFSEAESQIDDAIKGFEQVKDERLEVTAKEVKVRILIEETKINNEQLKQAEKLCSEILLTKSVRKQENFYLRGKIFQHLAQINLLSNNPSNARELCRKAKIHYELSLPQDSELVTNLTSFIQKNFYDLSCDQLSINDFQEFEMIQSGRMKFMNDVEPSEILYSI